MTRAGLALLLIALLLPLPAVAEKLRQVPIGYLELRDDPRYADDAMYAGIHFRTLGRPRPGAELGIADADAVGRLMGMDFSLQAAQGRSAEGLAAAVEAWVAERQLHFVIADLPAETLLRLADALAEQPVLLFNVSATEDRLRGAECRERIAHVIPSDAMLADALVQFLVERGWRRVLMLTGPAAADARRAAAFRRAADKFGAEIVAERSFTLSNSPRERERSNVRLLTDGPDYDAVFVADAGGEYGRYVPFQTALPRPVVGDAGLRPHAWHWSWHRHGAPQLQHRFEEAAPPRRMNDAAWAAWTAVKAVTQAALRAEGQDFAAMRDFILGPRLNLDSGKGNPASFRSWDRQLRQPLLLATADAVIARAPLPEFLHRENVLDTLGADGPQSDCRL